MGFLILPFENITNHHCNSQSNPLDDVVKTNQNTTKIFVDSLFPLEFSKTQRGRDMLLYGGYRYVENRQSTKNKFWRCSRYVKFGCRATIVTSKIPDEQSVRLSGSAHSHGPEKMAVDPKPFEANLWIEDKEEDAVENHSTKAESESDDGMAIDLIQKSLFQDTGSSDFYGVDRWSVE